MQKKKELTKQFTRDFSLYCCEWLREALRVSFEKAIGVGYKDYVIVGNGQCITIFYIANDFESVRQALLKKITSDKEWYFKRSEKFRRESAQSRRTIRQVVAAGIVNKKIIEQFRERQVRLFPMLRLSIVVPSIFAEDIRRQFGAYGQRIIDAAFGDRKASDGVFEMNDYSLRKLIAKRLQNKKKAAELAKLFTTKELLLFSEGKNVDMKEIERRKKGFVLCNDGLIAGADYQKIFSRHHYLFREAPAVGDTVRGTVAFNAPTVRGRVRLLFSLDQIETFRNNEILVTPMTVPDFMPAAKKAKAIVTDEGGITCHAAIVARELKKPCIIGTKSATKLFKTGDRVEVDAFKGIVRKI